VTTRCISWWIALLLLILLSLSPFSCVPPKKMLILLGWYLLPLIVPPMWSATALDQNWNPEMTSLVTMSSRCNIAI